MSLVLKSITIRNFLSVGAVTQAVNFDNQQLTLVLGENLDLGGRENRNGVGKTTLIQALTYVLFGTPINNIRKDNLINRTNAKNMLVTLEFSAKGIDYKIERGRKPNVLRFYVGNKLASSSKADSSESEDASSSQGENKETQLAIEHAIGMSSDMFKHIVALNTYVQPFLGMKANEQRVIIEQLLGITLLSEKAELVKEKIKLNKEKIQVEEFQNKAIEEANKRVQEQIDALKRRQNLWLKQHDESLSKLVADYDNLSKINIEHELQMHRDLNVWLEKKKQKDICDALIARQIAWKQKQDKDVQALRTRYEAMSHIDIDSELQSHKDLAEWKRKKAEGDSLSATKANLEKLFVKDQQTIAKLSAEIKKLEDHTCYACGQDFHDENHTSVLDAKRAQLVATELEFTQTKNELEKIKNSLSILGLGERPTTHYESEAEAIRHSSELELIQKQISAKLNETDPYSEQISEQCLLDELGPRPNTHYDTEAEAIEHKSVVAALISQIEKKTEDTDPYSEQIAEMENKALQTVSFETINELSKYGDHLKFLLDLLVSKDSFIRKKIVDQNLSYLNVRLTHYLDKIGLPHSVVFKNDLTVEITELGRELDFYNLSRGEANRLILGLSFAFRDVWENLYFPINSLFIDELIDSGMDAMGVENSIAILKDMSRNRSKSVWLVSHRDELAGRVPSILKVIKENGFTTFDSTTEIE